MLLRKDIIKQDRQARSTMFLDHRPSSSSVRKCVSPAGTLSPNGSFVIKQTPMQLYPKMFKVRVNDKVLGKSFKRAGKIDVAGYMEDTDRMVHHSRHISEAAMGSGPSE